VVNKDLGSGTIVR